MEYSFNKTSKVILNFSHLHIRLPSVQPTKSFKRMNDKYVSVKNSTPWVSAPSTFQLLSNHRTFVDHFINNLRRNEDFEAYLSRVPTRKNLISSPA